MNKNQKEKYVYFFGAGEADGDSSMRELLGGKGANLAEMIHLGLNVPPGFTISTEVCNHYRETGELYPGVKLQVMDAIKKMESIAGQEFGNIDNPLLLSVRSGASVSMPGMMETVLNLGLNDNTVDGLSRKTHDEKFSYDSYRRFIQMYGSVVMDVPSNLFSLILEDKKQQRKITNDFDLHVSDLKEIVVAMKEQIYQHTGNTFPEDPYEQMWKCIIAIFKSWGLERAEVYRRINNIPDDLGTAANLMMMVFGNMGNRSATGVVFTRNPSKGENIFYGEFLKNAQGEDVVAGIRTPVPILHLVDEFSQSYKELISISKRLEKHYRDMQDIEFTIQEGKLWILQCRSGKRTGLASFRIALDMVTEGLISFEEALLRVDAKQFNHFLKPIFNQQSKQNALDEGRLLARGLNAGPGAASGYIALSLEKAQEYHQQDKPIIFVRFETSPEDIAGLILAKGILTARGGMTSHAALVARQLGKVCVVGCNQLEMLKDQSAIRFGQSVLKEGELISIDGDTGEIIAGKIKTLSSEIVQVLIDKTLKPSDSIIYQNYEKLMNWTNQIDHLGVYANVDQPEQCKVAIAFGAIGVGLCRTEHMFFDDERIGIFRQMILTDKLEERKASLAQLLVMQQEDFYRIFEVMNNRVVTIRLLDPPLHEFLPKNDVEIDELARLMQLTSDEVRLKSNAMHESNPMLGFRGCRLGIVYPEITDMQVKAIVQGAITAKKNGYHPKPRIMIPLISDPRELYLQKKQIQQLIQELCEQANINIKFPIGTMLEVPRAALLSDEIAKDAEFFSFGTNDLTQTTFGISRDDSNHFFSHYLKQDILKNDPFEFLDEKGVGELIKMSIRKGLAANPQLDISVCGEHAGDPKSIHFFDCIGVHHISCSPFRIPIARLAAAQSVLKRFKNNLDGK